uniref:7-cyano-7-deazaguanine synthase n=1 Tax=Dictyoglomus turgidum TaxID=513050 RepID=A0A7C3SMN6_9BACT
MKKAVVILSGGLDSSTCLFIAKKEGHELYALTFLYGQRHSKEIECAKRVAEIAGVKEHRIINLPTPKGSALTDSIEVPQGRSLEEICKEIPVTYVPARNTLFIAYALQYAEEIDADAIFTGVTAVDASGYPDTRPEYIQAWQNLINNATKKTTTGGTIKLRTPLLHLYKSEIIEIGNILKVPYEYTWSCYKGEEEPCLECDTCKLRIKGFIEAGVRDPLVNEDKWKEVLEKWEQNKSI